MFPSGFPSLRLAAVSLSAGIAAGWTLRQGKADGPFPSDAAGSPGPAIAAGTNAVEPFSMERFRAALGLPMHRMLARVLPGADAALVRALAENLAARPEFPPDPVWNALFARWVQLDAPAALAWARSVEGKDLAKTAVKAWAEADLESALAAAPASGVDHELLQVHLVLAQTDPGRAMALFDALAKKDEASLWLTGDFIETVFAKWAELDPRAAAAHLRGLNPEDLLAKHESSWENLAAHWGAQDPAACRSWLAGLKPPFFAHALSGLAVAARKNPAAVAEILRTIPVTDETFYTFQQVARTWASVDAPAAMAWARERFPGGKQRNRLLTQVAWEVMRQDLSAAVAIMDSIGWDEGESSRSSQKRLILPNAGGENGKAISTDMGRRSPYWSDFFNPESISSVLISRLGRQDPALALRQVGKMDPAAHAQLFFGFVPDWFESQPEAVTRWLENMPPDGLSAPQLERLIGQFPGLKREAALAWAERLPPGPLRQALAGISMEGMAGDDPAAAVEAIPFSDAGSRQAALDKIIRDWSITAPQAALDRLVRETAPLPETCEAVVEEWTLHDPTAASTWVAALPPGPNRDAAIKGLAASLTDSDAQPDFPAALMWSLSITDPAVRLAAAHDIVDDWEANAAEATEMRTALETTTTLPEEERQTLLRLLTP